MPLWFYSHDIRHLPLSPLAVMVVVQRHAPIQRFLLVGGAYNGPCTVRAFGVGVWFAVGGGQGVYVDLGRFVGEGDGGKGGGGASGRSQPSAPPLQ